MTLQNTASKSDLILNCARPFTPGLDVENTAGDPARYGTGVHGVLYKGLAGEVTSALIRAELTAAGYVRISDDLIQEVFQHVKRTVAALTLWLQGENPWGARYRIVGAERHLASQVRILRGGAIRVDTRETAFEETEHKYELASFEIGGTYDLLLEREKGVDPSAPARIVIDYKTGDSEDFTDPRTSQLLTLALMTDADAVAILHTPRQGAPVVYAAEVGSAALAKHARALRAGMRRQGDGSMRPGPWCGHCPARVGCPAKDTEFLSKASTMLAVVSANHQMVSLPREVTPGAMHQFIGAFEKLAKVARERLKAEVAEGALYQRPDGKILTLRPGSRENLSKASIERALGPTKAAKVVARLRKQGCIDVSNYESLVAVKED